MGVYSQLMQVQEQKEPLEHSKLRRLFKDFMGRGTKLRGRTQENLGAYWKWLLFTYGHQLLDRLGTFHFLQTELVPLHLISHKKMQDTSL